MTSTKSQNTHIPILHLPNLLDPTNLPLFDSENPHDTIFEDQELAFNVISHFSGVYQKIGWDPGGYPGVPLIYSIFHVVSVNMMSSYEQKHQRGHLLDSEACNGASPFVGPSGSICCVFFSIARR
jgi:hypothetical protein